jgi:hypothetical protein
VTWLLNKKWLSRSRLSGWSLANGRWGMYTSRERFAGFAVTTRQTQSLADGPFLARRVGTCGQLPMPG